MRIGLRGSASTGRLGSLPQHSGPRPRSGKGTWSRVGSGGHNSLPRQLVHGGMGAGGSGRSSASWTKMSAATRTPPYTSGHEPSPSQPLAAKILSNADAPPSQARCSSPINHTGRVGAFDDVGSGGHVDGPRWTGDKVPFRDPWHRALGLSTKDDSLAGGGESKTTETVKPVLLNPLVADNSMQCARGTSPSLQTNGSCVGADESRTCAAEAGLGFDLSDAEFDRLCHSEDRHCIFAPKTICVISRFPIYSVLRRFLRHLYAISLSRSGVPLERYISMFVSCIPMPSPGESVRQGVEREAFPHIANVAQALSTDFVTPARRISVKIDRRACVPVAYFGDRLTGLLLGTAKQICCRTTTCKNQ